jgi:glycosyltransferase involved in cell wall biosynthesis
VFVAPLRYGAGMNGKVGHALGYRLPMVTTEVGAAGFGLTDGQDALIAEGAEAFAAAIVALHEGEALWTRIAARAADPLAAFGRSTVVGAALEIIDRAVAGRATRVPITV